MPVAALIKGKHIDDAIDSVDSGLTKIKKEVVTLLEWLKRKCIIVHHMKPESVYISKVVCTRRRWMKKVAFRAKGRANFHRKPTTKFLV
eukprot:CAMPEP_0116903000 /NCGR_PEP_ID=MMETSP0467-20121206/10445_1 /TAXON_ID=283647 /ORGANISM="Mesodinium pulex, Strain SPMC105" /LENGTH=88 /DNA_ID=CAMNT_0004577135 /DNA_START=480 /DNA_END=746 /DNA_ORIENTATION=-